MLLALSTGPDRGIQKMAELAQTEGVYQVMATVQRMAVQVTIETAFDRKSGGSA